MNAESEEADLFVRAELHKAQQSLWAQVICSKMQMPEAFEILYAPILFLKVHLFSQCLYFFCKQFRAKVVKICIQSNTAT